MRHILTLLFLSFSFLASSQNLDLDTTLVHSLTQEKAFSMVKESYVGLFLYDTRYTYIDDKNYIIVSKGSFESNQTKGLSAVLDPIYFTLKTDVTEDSIIVTMKEFYIGQNKKPLIKSNIGGRSFNVSQQKKLMKKYHSEIEYHYNLILSTIENNIKD